MLTVSCLHCWCWPVCLIYFVSEPESWNCPAWRHCRTVGGDRCTKGAQSGHKGAVPVLFFCFLFFYSTAVFTWDKASTRADWKWTSLCKVQTLNIVQMQRPTVPEALVCVCVCHVCVCAGLCVCLCASYPQSHANNPRILRVRNLDVNLVLNCKSVLFLFVCLFFCNYFVQQLKASESKHMQQNERAKNDTMIQHHCNHTDFWPPFFCITLRLTVLSEQFRQVWNSSKAVVPKVGAQTPFNFLFSQFAANKEKVEILRPRHPLWERHGLKGNWNDQSLASATVYPWTPQLSDELSPSGVQQFWGDSADDLNLQKKVFHVLTFMWKWSLSVVCG